MWSWWDCMQWWNSAWDSAMPWPMELSPNFGGGLKNQAAAWA